MVPASTIFTPARFAASIARCVPLSATNRPSHTKKSPRLLAVGIYCCIGSPWWTTPTKSRGYGTSSRALSLMATMGSEGAHSMYSSSAVPIQDWIRSKGKRLCSVVTCGVASGAVRGKIYMSELEERCVCRISHIEYVLIAIQVPKTREKATAQPTTTLSLYHWKLSPVHLFKGKAQRGWNGRGAAGEIIAPHHGRLASRKDTLRLVHIAYLVFHIEARAPDSDNTHANLYGVRTYQRHHIGTGNFFDQQPVVTPTGSCLNTRIVRGVRDNAFYFLMFLARRPLLQPGL